MSSTGCDLYVKAVALFQKHSLLGSLHFLQWCRGTRCQSAVCESLLGAFTLPRKASDATWGGMSTVHVGPMPLCFATQSVLSMTSL